MLTLVLWHSLYVWKSSQKIHGVSQEKYHTWRIIWISWKIAEQLMKRMDEENGWNPLFIVPTGSNGSQRVPTGPNGLQQVWGGGGGKVNDPSCWGGGGQYKMDKSIIFINCEHNLCDISLVKHSEFLWTFPEIEWISQNKY